jgi:hypothetical protein
VTRAASRARVGALRPQEQQRHYVVEQVSRALGHDWLERNADLLEDFWEAVLALGYALPDERRSEEHELA